MIRRCVTCGKLRRLWRHRQCVSCYVALVQQAQGQRCTEGSTVDPYAQNGNATNYLRRHPLGDDE